MYYWECDKCGEKNPQDIHGRYSKLPINVYGRNTGVLIATVCQECSRKYNEISKEEFDKADEKVQERFFGKKSKK